VKNVESKRKLRTKRGGRGKLKRKKYGKLWQVWSSHSSTAEYLGLQIWDAVLLVTA
jgi:hypothetical protein